MPVLIIEHIRALGLNWAAHLAQFDLPIVLAPDLSAGFGIVRGVAVRTVVIDLDHDVASALALADYVEIRRPGTPVVLVTPDNPWVGSEMMIHAPNACAILGRDTAPGDLAAMVAHHAAATRSR